MTDDLESNSRDKLVSAARGALSAVPFVGGLLGELISNVIPNQRHDRIVEYLRNLEDRISQMEEGEAKIALASPEKIDLIESGGFQAARATTGERINLIAHAVANGLCAKETEVVRRKRLLKLLGEIDDDELAILVAYGRSYAGGHHDAFGNINIPEPSHLGAERELIDLNKLYELGKNRLVQLGLLRKNYGSVKKGQIPEFDARSGEFKHRLEISYLGRLLLRESGVALPFED
jgi:hypothetical protein